MSPFPTSEADDEPQRCVIHVLGAGAILLSDLGEPLMFEPDGVHLVDVVGEAGAIDDFRRVALRAAAARIPAVDSRRELAFRAREQHSRAPVDFELVAEGQDADEREEWPANREREFHAHGNEAETITLVDFAANDRRRFSVLREAELRADVAREPVTECRG